MTHIPDDKLTKALNFLTKEQFDEAFEKSGLLVELDKKFSGILKLKQQLKNDKLSVDEISLKKKEIYNLENQLLEINEEISTKKTYGLSAKNIDEGEGIEAYGPEEWTKMEIERRRNSEIGKKLLKVLDEIKA